ncbi:MAG: hypothetical protein U0359_24125 [Byssovorax sp.]
MNTLKLMVLGAVAALSGLTACESSNSPTTGTTGSGGSSSTTSTTTTTGSGTGGGADVCGGYETVTAMDNASCKHSATDFDPKNTANDGWAACKSDDGIFHPFDVNVGSDKRTVAFDAIGKLLGFGTIAKPDAQAFIDAKVLYVEPEGIESRVVRREDWHYPEAPKACNMMTPDEQAMYKDRCVGPQKLMPVINQAFTDGAKGIEPTANAIKLEAALLWMFYISAFAESNSCFEDLGDCDSASGYYSGSRSPDEPHGLASYIKARSPQAHQYVWDGLLAIQCWRDQDAAIPPAKPELQDQAKKQFDRALLRGMALIFRQKVENIDCPEAAIGAKFIGELLDRESRARDAAKADVIKAELAKSDITTIDKKAITDAVDALYDCP